MEDMKYHYERELVEEILLGDKDFFSDHSLEFNIFKYTAIFAVYTFTIQIVLLLIQNVYGLNYFSYGQAFILFFGIAGVVALLELYRGLTRTIKRSTVKKKIYAKYFRCEKCDFFTFSQFNSTLHILSKPYHSIDAHLIMVRGNKPNSPVFKLERLKKIFSHSDKVDFRGLESGGVIVTSSNHRIQDELKEKPTVSKTRLAEIMLFVLFFLGYVFYIHSLHISLTIVAVFLIVIFLLFFSENFITVIEDVKEDDDTTVHLLFLQISGLDTSKIPNVSFNLFSCGRLYWDHVKKENIKESIETPKGPLFLIETMVLNRFEELIEVNYNKRSESSNSVFMQ